MAFQVGKPARRSRLGRWTWPAAFAWGLVGCADAPREVGSTHSALVFCTGPTIGSWYGDTLHPGLIGHAQRHVNVLGNVPQGDGTVTLSRSLNGGPYVAVPLGPDSVRLQRPGDFNIHLRRAMLADGPNTLALRAEDGSGGVCNATLMLDYDPSSVWPLPYSASFDSISSAEEIEQLVEVVDGPWEATGDGLRTVQRGYYRTLAVGDESWSPGYQVRATVTVHYLGDWSGVGLGIGWQGHVGTGDPPTDWPVGALGWVRVKTTGPALEIKTFDSGTPASMPVDFVVDETYVFEMRGETLGEETMRVSVRMWPSSEDPPDWLVAPVDARGGSAVLLAHGADVTWHDVEVSPLVPLDGGVTPTDGGSAGPDGATPDGGSSADAGRLPDGRIPGTDAGGRSGSTGGGCSAAPVRDAPGWPAGAFGTLLLGWAAFRLRARSRRGPWSRCPR